MAIASIAHMTFRNQIRQPVTWITTILGVAFLLLSMSFGQFNFESDDRMRLVLTAGVAVVLLHGLFLGITGASAAIYDELQSRTALTLFAKPIDRWQFLLGKGIGTFLSTSLSSGLLILIHLVMIAVIAAEGFDQVQDHDHDHDHSAAIAWTPYGRIIGAHALALCNTMVLVCLASALALRLPYVINILICFAVFVIAHVLGGHGSSGLFIIPALNLFNIDEALQFQEQTLHPAYLALSLCYGTLYSMGCLFLGMALFEEQDIP